jgi:hypothetical protein
VVLAWRHPGFSAHVGEPIAPEQKQHLEDTAAYLVRNPLSLKKLVYLDGERITRKEDRDYPVFCSPGAGLAECHHVLVSRRARRIPGAMGSQ